MKNTVSSAFNKIGSVAKSVFNQITRYSKYAVASLLAIATASVKMAMSAEESNNLFEVSMGRMASSTRKWSEELSKKLYLNGTEVRNFVGTFNVMLESMGLGASKSVDMSKALTQLAYDMSSFYNLKPSEAFQKLQAAIAGEAEPLKRLGILINETTLKQYALANGIGSSSGELTEQEKVMARYGLILQSTNKAQGDLERTLDSSTNVFRSVWSLIQRYAIELGDKLKPQITAVAIALRDWLTSNETNIGNWMLQAVAGILTLKEALKATYNTIVRYKEIIYGLGIAFVSLSVISGVTKLVLGFIGGIGTAITIIGGFIGGVSNTTKALLTESMALGQTNSGIVGFTAATSAANLASTKFGASLTAQAAAMSQMQILTITAARQTGAKLTDTIANFGAASTTAVAVTSKSMVAIIASSLGTILAIALAAFTGWKLGEWLSEKYKLVADFGNNVAAAMLGTWESIKFNFWKAIYAMGDALSWIKNEVIKAVSDILLRFGSMASGIENLLEKIPGVGKIDLGSGSLIASGSGMLNKVENDQLAKNKRNEELANQHAQNMLSIAKAYYDSTLEVEKKFKEKETTDGIFSFDWEEQYKTQLNELMSVQENALKKLQTSGQSNLLNMGHAETPSIGTNHQTILDQIEEQKKAREEATNAISKMYSDLQGKATGYYDQQKAAIQAQADNFTAAIEAAGQLTPAIQALIDKWTEYQNRQIEIQDLEQNGGIFGGIKASSMKMLDSIKTVGQIAAETWTNMADGFSDSMSTMILEGGSFKDIMTGYLKDMGKMLVQLLMKQATMQLWGGIGNAIGGAFSSTPLTTAGVKHSGGTIGATSAQRKVHPAVFTNAERYHEGGVVGLKSNEKAIIAKIGERVTPAGQSSNPSVNVTVIDKSTRMEPVKQSTSLTRDGVLNIVLEDLNNPNGQLPKGGR